MAGTASTPSDAHDRARLPTIPAAQQASGGGRANTGPPRQPTLPAVRQAILKALAQPQPRPADIVAVYPPEENRVGKAELTNKSSLSRWNFRIVARW